MGDLQIKKNAKQYDVVIVGSGAGGGMACGHAGTRCLLGDHLLAAVDVKTLHAKARG